LDQIRPDNDVIEHHKFHVWRKFRPHPSHEARIIRARVRIHIGSVFGTYCSKKSSKLFRIQNFSKGIDIRDFGTKNKKFRKIKTIRKTRFKIFVLGCCFTSKCLREDKFGVIGGRQSFQKNNFFFKNF